MLIALGERIRKARTNAGLTQYELADKCGFNRNYVGMLERGERNATYITLVKVADGCGVKVGKLV